MEWTLSDSLESFKRQGFVKGAYIVDRFRTVVIMTSDLFIENDMILFKTINWTGEKFYNMTIKFTQDGCDTCTDWWLLDKLVARKEELEEIIKNFKTN